MICCFNPSRITCDVLKLQMTLKNRNDKATNKVSKNDKNGKRKAGMSSSLGERCSVKRLLMQTVCWNDTVLVMKALVSLKAVGRGHPRWLWRRNCLLEPHWIHESEQNMQKAYKWIVMKLSYCLKCCNNIRSYYIGISLFALMDIIDSSRHVSDRWCGIMFIENNIILCLFLKLIYCIKI